ncbi:ABC transporter substrate-binding protein [Emticicia sp. W12TSBA100-4]|uniref:ABC transporter substrate-binding protein n=1 Tax=Emticicia sp. W12TSBA100-4 TaxID=3160965 RepID=UPI003305FA47
MKPMRFSFYAALLLGIMLVSCNNNKSENTVKIGLVLGLSGNGSVNGKYHLEGYKMAIEEQNKKGGILGKKIELDIQDSKLDPKEGLISIKNMYESSLPPFIVCSNGSPVSMAIKPEVEKNKSIFLAAAAASKLIENSNYTIRNYVDAKTISENMVPYITDSLKLKKLGIFYVDNDFGKSVSNSIIAKIKGTNLNNTFIENFNDKESDFKSLLSKITPSTEIIYVIGVGKGLGILIKQIKESGYKGKIIADPLSNTAEVKNAAGQSILGIRYLDFAFDNKSESKKIKEFVQSYKKSFGKEPSDIAALSYVGLKLVFKSIEEVGEFDSKKIIQNLEKIKNIESIMGGVSVSERSFIYPFVFEIY